MIKRFAFIPFLLAFLLTIFAPNSVALADPSGESRQRTIFFVTTRLNEGSAANPQYNGKRHLDLGAGSLDFGVASIDRPDGLVGFERAPDWLMYRQGMIADDQKWRSAEIGRLANLSQSDLLTRVQNFRGTICIFVHGYGESMERSLRDAAVLADALERKGVPVFPILFSWPSLNDLREYAKDEANIEWSKVPFIGFVDSLSLVRSRDSRVCLVTHSMGSRLAFSLLYNDDLVNRAPIDELILSAADYDYFEALQQFSRLNKLVKGDIFVFVSDRDGPLTASQMLHGSPRLGRPFDPPHTSMRPSDYMHSQFWDQLLQDAADVLMPGGLNNPPEMTAWLQQHPNMARELGDKAQFLDVSELVSEDLGHRISWSLIASLLAKGAGSDDTGLNPLATEVVYKRPDQTTLEQNGGTPPFIFKFHRISGNLYGTPRSR